MTQREKRSTALDRKLRRRWYATPAHFRGVQGERGVPLTTIPALGKRTRRIDHG